MKTEINTIPNWLSWPVFPSPSSEAALILKYIHENEEAHEIDLMNFIQPKFSLRQGLRILKTLGWTVVALPVGVQEYVYRITLPRYSIEFWEEFATFLSIVDRRRTEQ
jgi:hypothetical protein